MKLSLQSSRLSRDRDKAKHKRIFNKCFFNGSSTEWRKMFRPAQCQSANVGKPKRRLTGKKQQRINGQSSVN